jgi:transmembrane 9 superfamily protein 2/4
VRITLLSHTNPGAYKDYRIVGFEVEPFSMTQATLQNEDGTTQVMCQDGVAIQEFRLRKNSEIIFTYDVQWVDSPIRWASRWDSYLQMSGGQIHWFSIMNSLMIVLCLSVMIAMILLRTLYRDIAKYNEIATDEEAKEETGWKLVHGDVFREPTNSDMLVVSVGSGVQLFCMVVVTLICALFGLLSPARRGVLLQSMMILFTLMGVIGGYAMSRFYKLFLKNNWKRPTVLTAVFYPGIVFIVFFVLNLLIWQEKSSGAVPFATMFAMLALWFGVSVPLVFVGAYVGFGQGMIELPVRVSKIPRTIPEQSFYNNSILTAMAGGILPFGAVFTEMFFIMSSIWQHQFYYLFGFLALVLVILIVTCAEISIALTYFQLTAEDHRWWWRSFTTSGSAGVYLFLNAILYYNTRLNITHFAGTVLYFGYMGVMSLCFSLLTGSIGFIASFLFVKAIYGSIKID